MAVITERFGSGGANISPSSQGTPTLAGALRDVADDLVGLKVAEIASPDATDDASSYLLINEIKDALNAVNGYEIKTTKG